ncbi:MAG: DNA mismatch endonuclease Vsr [Nitrospirae bacterium]|nr:DNA mismatch endonuclease Vsr [Nitrospirota bacterium]
MPDSFSKIKRSLIMKSVKSRGNKSTELKFIKFLKKFQIKGWRRNYKLNGKPDFVFPKKRVVIFTDGCFWHGHNCRNTKPKDNAAYWEDKIQRNKTRDKIISETLEQAGWQVIRVWECEIKNAILCEKLKTLVDEYENSGLSCQGRQELQNDN